MVAQLPRWRRPERSVEGGVLRAATLAMALSWPLWQLERARFWYPDDFGLTHWFPTLTMVMFGLANLTMLGAWVTGQNRYMILANRITGFTIPAALLLLLVAVVQSDLEIGHGLWFTGFCGIPAVAFALTVPIQVGIPWFVLTVGGTTLVSGVLQGRYSWYDLAGDTGFAIINTFAFIVIAAAATRIARVTDATEAEAMRDQSRAARLNARSEEMTRFTALIHDQVLSELYAIANGVKPTGTVNLHMDGGLRGGMIDGADEFIDTVTECVKAEAPDCDIVIRGDANGHLDVPEPVAANMLLALREVARNSARHAGPGAHRTCIVEVGAGTVTVSYGDDGPGFDPEAVSHTRAGLRVSVLGRMASLSGGSASIDSGPEEGARVTLRWEDGESARGRRTPAPVDRADEPVYSLLGMNIIFSWQFGLAIAAVLSMLLLLGEAPTGVPELATAGLIVIALMLLIPGRHEVLPLPRTVALVLVLILIVVVGSHQSVVQTEWLWNRMIYINGMALIASLLAIRGRPVAAAVAVIGAGAVMQVLAALGLSPVPEVGLVLLMSYSILVYAAALVHLGVKYFFERLPRARDERLRAERAAAEAEAAKEHRRRNLAWLEKEVLPILDAVAVLDPPTERLRNRARLTELRLRDLLRSPLLDRPALVAAIADARGRGVHVQLLDDRSGWNRGNGSMSGEMAGDGVDADSAVAAVTGPVIRMLDEADAGDSVTVRVLPPGRSAFATLSDGTGVQRIAADGSVIGDPEPEL